MLSNDVRRQSVPLQRFASFAVFGLMFVGFSVDSRACQWRRRCSCHHVSVAWVPCRPYPISPCSAAVPQWVAAPPYAAPKAPVAPVLPSAPAPYVFLAPNGKRYVVRVTHEPGTEEKLRLKLEDRLKTLTTLERSMTASDSDGFVGNDRKAAKTSISQAAAEPPATLSALLASLPDDQSMLHHDPKITEDADSNRVAEEERNVTVTAFLFAVKSESDHDFHLILGTDTDASAADYMNAEVSGLPDTGPSRAALRSVRDKFKSQFAGAHIGTSYHHFDPPIPVTISGSLFYDIDHAPGVVGPAGQRPKTSWEVHPITDIEIASN
ncbi:MAG: hypothetical protein P4L84_05125 [Isosphaeraceae bacterium]|nr:hypothetical protein [Isosphaeraceae bacterium]